MKNIFYFLAFIVSNSWAQNLPYPRYYHASFVIRCYDVKNPFHLMPLSFLEFNEGVIPKNVGQDPMPNLSKLSPRTFKDFDRKLNSMKLVKKYHIPSDEDFVDPLVKPPKNCSGQVIAMRDIINSRVSTTMEVHSDFWDQLPDNIKKYLLIEATLEEYLKGSLAPADFRRFALYVTSGMTNTFSSHEKSFFLEFHGIKE